MEGQQAAMCFEVALGLSGVWGMEEGVLHLG